MIDVKKYSEDIPYPKNAKTFIVCCRVYVICIAGRKKRKRQGDRLVLKSRAFQQCCSLNIIVTIRSQGATAAPSVITLMIPTRSFIFLRAEKSWPALCSSVSKPVRVDSVNIWHNFLLTLVSVPIYFKTLQSYSRFFASMRSQINFLL